MQQLDQILPATVLVAALSKTAVFQVSDTRFFSLSGWSKFDWYSTISYICNKYHAFLGTTVPYGKYFDKHNIVNVCCYVKVNTFMWTCGLLIFVYSVGFDTLKSMVI